MIIEKYRPLYEACRKRKLNELVEKAEEFTTEGFAEDGFVEVFCIPKEIMQIVKKNRA